MSPLSRLPGAIHAACRRGYEVLALVVLIERQDEVALGIAVFRAEGVDPLDGFQQHPVVEVVRIVLVGRQVLLKPDIKNEAADRLDLVQKPVGRVAKLTILGDIGHRVEACAFLHPNCRMDASPLDLKIEKLAFSLEEPRAETAHLIHRQHEPGQPENRALLVFCILAIDIGTDMAEFIEIGV
ncbi:hypothetical protein [Mesorhizobium sp.]|uniref:hypothetical protein n=1 Tax=Mesorhizobium sp. TaxID=1871066 RepID=UPI0032AF5770